MTGYLIGKVVTVSGTILISVAATLITGALLFSGLAVGSASTWLTLIPVVLLGLLATLPIGAVLGSLFPSARSAGLLTLAIAGWPRSPESSIRLPICRTGSNGSGRRSRCTGWGSARVRPCCPRTWPRWKSVIPGGTWPPSAC